MKEPTPPKTRPKFQPKQGSSKGDGRTSNVVIFYYFGIKSRHNFTSQIQELTTRRLSEPHNYDRMRTLMLQHGRPKKVKLFAKQIYIYISCKYKYIIYICTINTIRVYIAWNLFSMMYTVYSSLIPTNNTLHNKYYKQNITLYNHNPIYIYKYSSTNSTFTNHHCTSVCSNHSFLLDLKSSISSSSVHFPPRFPPKDASQRYGPFELQDPTQIR